MYQQGYPDGPQRNGQDWNAAQPANTPAPRRRSRSRAQSEANAATQAPPYAAAPQQQSYAYANNGLSHPADQPSGYNAGYNNYAAPYPPQGGYPQGYPGNSYHQQGQPAYAQNGYPEQPPHNDPNYPQGGYPQGGYSPYPQNHYPASHGYPRQEACPPQEAYPRQGYYQNNGYAQPNETAPEPNAYADYPEPSGYGTGYYPPETTYPEQPAGKQGGGSPSGPRNGIIAAVTLFIVAAAIGLIVLASRSGQNPDNTGNPPASGAPAITMNKNQAAAYSTTFLPNVYVDGICLADMTFQEGSDAVWAQAREKQSGWYVRLKNENGSYKDITADMLGISFDPTSALQQAWAIGHTPDANGQVNDKALLEAVNVALTTEYRFTSAQQSANTSPIDTILDTLQTNAYRAPQDAVILSFNPDDFVNPFTFQQEVWGQWLDVSAVKQEILNKVSTLESGEVLLQITPIAPNVTVADLQKTVTLRCRAVTPISSSSTEERTNNIRVAMSKINGKSLAHGDKFSFNKFVGRRTIENGFFEAIEYAYGEEVMGVGGGVCRASTTVYLAAIQSGMTITHRDAHSNPVNYTSLGMDATVSDTRGREVDFTFKNESGGRIFIAAHVVESGSNRRSLLCEVRIYGPSLDDVHYKLESETIEVLPKPEEPKLKEDKTGEHAFYVDETKMASKGREGYVVDTYLCTYQGDTLISRDKVSTDTYPARQDVMWVGVNFR